MGPTFELVLLYLLAGVAIGPHALALAKDSAGSSYLDEFGVVFLMFVLGLEFNLPRLNSIHNVVFGLGLSQVLLTVVSVVFGYLLLCWMFSFTSSRLDLSWQGAVVLGGAMAMSSTAIVVKLMVERLEPESEHGRRVLAVLLFQDLAVVPLLVLIPALDLGARDIAESLGWPALEATVLLTLLLVGGPRAMRWWLTQVARRKSEELFVLNLLLASPLRGLRLTDLPRLHALGVAILLVRRGGGGVLESNDELRLEGADTLVLSGLPEPLALAEAKLLATRQLGVRLRPMDPTRLHRFRDSTPRTRDVRQFPSRVGLPAPPVGT